MPSRLRHLSTPLGILLALAVGCSAERSPRAATAPAQPALTADASDDYRAACASCHGLDARGHGPVAASLRTPPADLTLLAARHGGTFPFEAVVATIAGESPDIAAQGPGAIPADGPRAIPADGPRAIPADGPRAIPAHGSRAMPVWSLRFGSDAGATAVASISAHRRVEGLARYLETLQRVP